jgi:HK97 family phage major capsid protein
VRHRAKPEYRAAFTRYLTHGERGMSAEEQRAIQADDDVKAGFLVADEQFVGDLIKFLDDEVYVRKIANVLPTLTTAKSLGVPTLDTDVSDADWTGEIGTVQEDDSLATGKREFTPSLLSKLAKVAQKLLRLTSGGASSLVLERLGYKFAVTQEKAFLTGTGAGQPLGVFTASDNGVPTSRDVSTGNTTSAFVADNLRRVKMSLKDGHRKVAQWLFHTDSILMLSLLKYGDGKYIWTEGLRVGEPDRLLNLPIMESVFAPNTFTSAKYVGILANWKHYWIVDALDMQIQRLDELYAGTNQVGFIGRMESDGMPVLAEAFARVKLG